jgi:hypothetical protein
MAVPLVECWRNAYECGHSHSPFRKLGLIFLSEEVQWLTVLRQQRSL